jgi:hypothetical protein
MLHVRRPKSEKTPSKAASPEAIRFHIAAIEEAVENDLRPVGLYLQSACLVALSALEGWSPTEIHSARVDDIEQRLSVVPYIFDRSNLNRLIRERNPAGSKPSRSSFVSSARCTFSTISHSRR